MGSFFESIGSTLVSIIATILYGMFNSLVGPFLDLNSLQSLLFGDFETKEKVYFKTFLESELLYGYIPLSEVVMYFAVLLFVALIVIAGMRISSSSMSPNKRNEVFEFSKELILVGFGLSMLGEFYSLLFEINGAVVNVFASALDGMTNSIGQFEVKLEFDDIDFEKDTGLLGTFVVTIVEIGITIWTNFYYLMRKLTLLLLMSLGPLFLVMWMFPAWKGVTMAWLKELTGTIFIQALHCFVYWAILVMSVTQNWVVQVLAMALFIPITEQLRGLMGMGGNMAGTLNKIGGMAGLSALGTMAGAVKGAMGDKGVMGSLKELKDGAKSFHNDVKEKGLGEALSDTASKAKDAMFADGKAGAMLKAGEIGSKAGKAVFGTAGSIAGMGMGPIGSIIGAEAGSKIGDAAGGVLGRTGGATGLGIKSAIDRGTDKTAERKDAIENGDQRVVDALAGQEAAAWAGKNKEATMAQLRKNFPSASQAELEDKYNDVIEQKKQALLNDGQASQMWKSAKEQAGKLGNAEQLVEQAAQSMANQWAVNNQKEFNDEFAKNSPQLPGESDEVYANRRSEAFKDKKNAMRDNFRKDGQIFARDKADSEGNVVRGSLAQFMGDKAGAHADIGNVSGLEKAALHGMEHVAGAALFSNKGIPNMATIAGGLARAKTAQQRQEFIAQETKNGATLNQAEASWQQQEPSKLKENYAAYNKPSVAQALEGAYRPAPKGMAENILGNTAAFASGAINIDGMRNGKEIVTASLKGGTTVLKSELASGNIISAIPSALKGANKAGIEAHIAQHGDDAVSAQRAVVQSAGYAGGVLLGRTGLGLAQKIMGGSTDMAGYGSQVQSQISSASDVIQMAQKTTDPAGNQMIVPGAIRQVTTRDGSYVQVRSQTGEHRTVSRIGAGEESLKMGETIYQDLTSADGRTLEIAKVGKSGVSTYKMDSGGARIPVQANVQNPLSLLGNVDTPQNAYIERPKTPVLSQKVDNGQFYTEDLAAGVKSGQFSNVQVVTNKESRYMTAQDKNGVTWRVSPITKGDARLASNEVVSIPVEVTAGGNIINKQGEIIGQKEAVITPTGGTIVDSSGQSVGYQNVAQTKGSQQVVTQKVTQSINKADGSAGNRQVVQRKTNVLEGQAGQVKTVHNVVNHVDGGSNTVEKDYYTGDANFDFLLQSRLREMAAGRAERRHQIDRFRRKQGV